MKPLQVRRSTLKMWLISLAGIPLIVIAIDVLFQRRLTGALSDMIFPDNDPQLFEARDLIWAWVMLAVGLGLIGFGLKELIVPRAVLRMDDSGLAIRLSGPTKPATLMPWSQIEDVRADRVEDEGDILPVLVVVLRQTFDVPRQPFGARWLDQRTLMVATSDWDRPVGEVAEMAAAYAVELAREGRI